MTTYRDLNIRFITLLRIHATSFTVVETPDPKLIISLPFVFF